MSLYIHLLPTASTTSTAQGSNRSSVSKHGSSGGGNNSAAAGTITSLAYFQLKIDKEVLNTSVLTIPFLKAPIVRTGSTTTTADAHAGNMHSVAMVETTLYRRNGKDSW